ncbi:MAG: tryptophan synthase subunit alpha [Propionibacteriaceae bacterium]|jgi:tryptophan synthase alpha chain|nr:tryptophan synthase subunit alpha [Propionibacteriaceae bacterium]
MISASRIREAFKTKAFIGFLTGGDPSIEDTRRYVNMLVDCGVNLVEIGVPFSDPVAEGPSIQASSARALASGTTLAKLLDLVETLRREDLRTVPLVLMTYLNPVHHYGYEQFFADAARVGVDGVIIPDLPFEEHCEVREIAGGAGVCLISMIAPTSMDRTQMIARQGEGFIYLVSSLGVTGERSSITTDIAGIISHIREVTDVPVAVGFGISNPEQVRELSAHADGVIVGSAIVNIIAGQDSDTDHRLTQYVTDMVNALRCPMNPQ